MTPPEGEKTSNLTNEVLRLNELSGGLRRQLLDRFVKKQESEPPTAGEAVEPNPIAHLIKKTVETQHIIEECLKILEVEVIMKLEGGN